MFQHFRTRFSPKAGILSWVKAAAIRKNGRWFYGNVCCILFMLILLAVIGVPLYKKHSEAALRVSVSVLKRRNLEILFQAPEVTVNEKDLALGYVGMSAATRLSIYNNDRNGCLLHFSGLGPPFEKALVDGLGSEVQVGATDAFVYQEYRKGTITRTLNYKFYLLDDAVPGNYPWPLTIALDEALSQ